jgi:MFS-type transporter involved in bile tolerance (Atg22 family)
VGLGYLGMTAGLLALGGIFALFPDHKAAAGFAAAGVLFFFFSVPIFLWVPERPPVGVRRSGDGPLGFTAALRGSFRIWARTLKEPEPRRFLLGNFFLTDVLNTTIFVFSLYCVQVFDDVGSVTDAPVRYALIKLSIAALVLGTVGGRATDRLGARTTLLLSAAALGVALLAGVLLPSNRFDLFVLAVATFGAFGLAGIWTAGRALLLRIAPPDRVGEYCGMYGLSLKVSLAGALLFGVLADNLPFARAVRYRWAMASGFLPLIAGTILIALLPRRTERSAAAEPPPR